MRRERGRSVHGEAEAADGGSAVVADADGGAEAPDEGPPRAGWRRAEFGAVFGERLGACSVGSGAEFAVDFVSVGVGEELVEEGVGGFEGEDLVGGEQRREALLPVIVAAFDLAFGLWSGGVAQRDAVKVESLAELGEGVRRVSEEEGMVVDVKGEREAVGEEDAGEEIEVSEKVFSRVKTGARIAACGVIKNVEKGLFLRLAWEPGVGSGVVLPERTEVAGLPAADGFGGLLIAGVRGELVSECPTADAGAVGLEAEAAQEFAGDGAVGGAGRGGEQPGGQRDGLRRPVRMMIAARNARLPMRDATGRACAQVIGAELVETTAADAQLGGYLCGGKPARAGLGEKMANERRRETARQLRFFIAPVIVGGWILRIPTDAGQD